MDLKDLNNQQLILLALLVSFITSIATGIVTVTLMEQAPPGITQTINRIIEKTVQVTAPDSLKTKEIITETIVIKEEELVIQAVEKNANNLLKIGILTKEKPRPSILLTPPEEDKEIFTPFSGGGFVIFSDGLLVTDLSLVSEDKPYAVETAQGVLYEANVVFRDIGNEFALLQIKVSEDNTKDSTIKVSENALAKNKLPFSDILFGDSEKVKVGQTAIALRLHEGASLLLGVISRLEREINTEGIQKIKRIESTIQLGSAYSGSPLVDIDAQVIGMNIIRESGTLAIPSNIIRNVVEEYRKTIRANKNQTVTDSIQGASLQSAPRP